MSEAIVLDALDLAALLCSRVCHDLISPVGAIVNGLEVLEEEKDEATRTFALDLIKKSARNASPRLLLPKNRVKLLLNMLIIAGQAIPRGGSLTVAPLGEGESMSFRITAAG